MKRIGISNSASQVGRVSRALARQLDQLDTEVQEQAVDLLLQAKQLCGQAAKPKMKNKLYSLHEPQVACISKGKTKKRYEFGTKVGIVCTQQEGCAGGTQLCGQSLRWAYAGR